MDVPLSCQGPGQPGCCRPSPCMTIIQQCDQLPFTKASSIKRPLCPCLLQLLSLRTPTCSFLNSLFALLRQTNPLLKAIKRADSRHGSHIPECQQTLPDLSRHKCWPAQGTTIERYHAPALATPCAGRSVRTWSTAAPASPVRLANSWPSAPAPPQGSVLQPAPAAEACMALPGWLPVLHLGWRWLWRRQLLHHLWQRRWVVSWEVGALWRLWRGVEVGGAVGGGKAPAMTES